jgi:hypothetical protein
MRRVVDHQIYPSIEIAAYNLRDARDIALRRSLINSDAILVLLHVGI